MPALVCGQLITAGTTPYTREHHSSRSLRHWGIECGVALAMEKLQLSDLSHGVDYPMSCEQDADRCRIHVKMTEISMKSVEGLIHSDKVSETVIVL